MAAPRDGHVHIWRIDHDDPMDPAALAELLSPAERRRALRFRRATDRTRWMVARAGLRRVLARYASAGPRQVLLRQLCRSCGGPHGPLELEGPAPLAALAVSMSHASRWSLVALTSQQPVGVDVEDLARLGDGDSVLATALSARERDSLSALTPAERPLRLLSLWVRKEAYLKGIGQGLRVAPRDIEVDGSACSSRASRDTSWHLHELAAGPQHLSAVAVRGGPCTLTTWDLGWAAPRWP